MKKIHAGLLATVNIAATIGILLVLIYRTYPMVGHDYAYIVSHVFDTYLHYRVNGLTVQWYTPSFGGGLPSYAHPQQMQFSVVQLLVFVLDPFRAVLLAMCLYMVLGMLCFYVFAKEVLRVDWRAALLGALIFTSTGFYYSHMISGAFGFMTFPLLSAVFLLLFWTRFSALTAGAWLGLLLASLVYQAGFYILVIFALSALLALPLLYLVRPAIFSLPAILQRVAVGGTFFALLSVSKLYAVFAFMRHFPRFVGADYTADYMNNGWMAFAFLGGQLTTSTLLTPLVWLAGRDVNHLPRILAFLSGYPYNGFWETDSGLSPVLFLALTVGFVRSVVALRRGVRPRIARDQAVALALLAAATWLTLEYALAKGWVYSLAKSLPILGSLHINYRFTSAFIFPLVVVGTVALHQWFESLTPRLTSRVFLALNAFALLSPLTYFLYAPDVHYRIYDVRGLMDAYQQAGQGEVFPVTSVAGRGVRDWDALPLGATTLKPYEPIFGYQLEAFAPKIQPGPILEVRDGYFNLTNPASLVYPETNGGQLFSLFAESDRQRLDEFTHRRQPDWKIPAAQRACNVLSAAAFVTAVLVVIADPWFRRLRGTGQGTLPASTNGPVVYKN